MDQKQIEKCLKRGQYDDAIAALTKHKASAWRDTTKLRCLRSQGNGKHALSLATQLNDQLDSKTSPYGTTLSERNHLRRYIALVFAEQGFADKAASLMQALIKASPNIAALHREYAFALTNSGQFDLAEDELRRALILQPSNAVTQSQLAHLYCRSARVRAGFDGYQRAATLQPNTPDYLQRLIYWSNHLPDTSQQSNYQIARLWASSLPKPTPASLFDHIDRNLDRKLNVGLVSTDFRAHASSFFIKPLMRGLDTNEFNITAYQIDPRSDAVTQQIKTLVDHWRDCATLSSDKISTLVIADNIDVLIDLNGHSSGAQLDIFHHRSAPLQISWLGGVSTTGLDNMDCRITDRTIDPAGLNEEFYTESLVRLQNSYLCYEPLSKTPKVNPSPTEKYFRFGSFNSLKKISELTLDCWATVLHAVPNSTLSIKHKQLKYENAKKHLLDGLIDRGIAADRILILNSDNTIEEHLERYNHIDVALDTSPYNGRTTTLEALWMGVPVLSLAGQTHCSRITSSILSQLSLKHLATDTIQDLARQAKTLADDPQLLGKLKSGLRDKMINSNLLNHQQFGRDFGFAIRQQWQQWASTKAATTATPKDIPASVIK